NLHPGFLLPRRTELGQPAIFPATSARALARRGARVLYRPILRRTRGAKAHPALTRYSKSRAAGRSACLASGLQNRNRGAATRRKTRYHGDGVAERARAACPPHGGKYRATRIAGRRGPDVQA